MVRLWVSISEKVRISSINSNRPSPEVFAVSTYSSCLGLNPMVINRSSMPRTAFIGVRNSCVTLAANSPLIRADSSAADMALTNSCCRLSRASIMELKACCISVISAGPPRSARITESPSSARFMVIESFSRGLVRRREIPNSSNSRITAIIMEMNRLLCRILCSIKINASLPTTTEI